MADNIDVYQIMFFEKGQKIFPVGSLSLVEYLGVNMQLILPPLTAKYLYEKYTEHSKIKMYFKYGILVQGWGGRYSWRYVSKR